MLQHDPDLLIVGEAGNVLSAQTLCQEVSPHLILLNTHVHDDDGIDVPSILSRNFPAAHLVLVATSGRAEDLFRTMPAGAATYLVRNATRQELVSAIHSLVDGALPDRTQVLVQLGQRLGSTPEDDHSAFEHLTHREEEVLQRITLGQTNRQIAQALGLSVGTVKIHVERILAKFGASDRTQAAVRAVELGLPLARSQRLAGTEMRGRVPVR